MGNCCQPFGFIRRPNSVNQKKITLLLAGLDNSGKTSVLNRLAGQPMGGEQPTVGFSTVVLDQKGCHVVLYDVGGGPQIRDIWQRYYLDVHGIIFVVDANDYQRIEETKKVFERMLKNDKISGKPILLLANKQDLDGALDEIDIVERLNVEPLVNLYKCPTLVELCSAKSPNKDIGLENGYKWLLRCITKDYPMLNNRVLLDQTQDEMREKLEMAARRERIRLLREERGEELLLNVDDTMYRGTLDPFRPLEEVLAEKKRQPNGVPHQVGQTSAPNFLEHERKTSEREQSAPETETETEAVATVNHLHTSRTLFNKSVPNLKKYNTALESDADLIQNMDIADDTKKSRNFLVRPKSSGARLYGTKSEWTSTKKKKKKLKKSNKTGPAPFTDISSTPQSCAIPKVFDPSYQTDIERFDTSEGEDPNSSKDSPKNIDVFQSATKEATDDLFQKAETSQSTEVLVMKENVSSGNKSTKAQIYKQLTRQKTVEMLDLNEIVAFENQQETIDEQINTPRFDLFAIKTGTNSKSMPSSRKNSAKSEKLRRKSGVTEDDSVNMTKLGKLPPLKLRAGLSNRDLASSTDFLILNPGTLERKEKDEIF